MLYNKTYNKVYQNFLEIVMDVYLSCIDNFSSRETRLLTSDDTKFVTPSKEKLEQKNNRFVHFFILTSINSLHETEHSHFTKLPCH